MQQQAITLPKSENDWQWWNTYKACPIHMTEAVQLFPLTALNQASPAVKSSAQFIMAALYVSYVSNDLTPLMVIHRVPKDSGLTNDPDIMMTALNLAGGEEIVDLMYQTNNLCQNTDFVKCLLERVTTTPIKALHAIFDKVGPLLSRDVHILYQALDAVEATSKASFDTNTPLIKPTDATYALRRICQIVRDNPQNTLNPSTQAPFSIHSCGVIRTKILLIASRLLSGRRITIEPTTALIPDLGDVEYSPIVLSAPEFTRPAQNLLTYGPTLLAALTARTHNTTSPLIADHTMRSYRLHSDRLSDASRLGLTCLTENNEEHKPHTLGQLTLREFAELPNDTRRSVSTLKGLFSTSTAADLTDDLDPDLPRKIADLDYQQVKVFVAQWLLQRNTLSPILPSLPRELFDPLHSPIVERSGSGESPESIVARIYRHNKHRIDKQFIMMKRHIDACYDRVHDVKQKIIIRSRNWLADKTRDRADANSRIMCDTHAHFILNFLGWDDISTLFSMARIAENKARDLPRPLAAVTIVADTVLANDTKARLASQATGNITAKPHGPSGLEDTDDTLHLAMQLFHKTGLR
ncbi:MAG: hypothetical protein VXZ73_00820 [Pseudomonadota bacterium]|nr:hypothetical protein [Pseudomonadota bacterium]